MAALSKAQIIQQYGKLASTVKNQYQPRKGYYWITSPIPTLNFHNDFNYQTVRAYWHPTEPDFENSPLFKVHLYSLFNSNSEGPKELHPDELITAIVYVSAVEHLQKTYNGEIKTVTGVTWELVDFKDCQLELSTPVPVKSIFEAENNGLEWELPEEFANEEDENELLQLLYDQQIEDEITRLLNAELDQLLFDEQAGDAADKDSEYLADMAEQDIEDDLTDID